jgi:hypothetical protein
LSSEVTVLVDHVLDTILQASVNVLEMTAALRG